MERLLVCIAFHYDSTRLGNLYSILRRLWNEYDMEVKVIIDTNRIFDLDTDLNHQIIVHSLTHPYHLTWMHRRHFIYNIDNFDYFMYLEDDMDVPYLNFKEYLVNFRLLYPNYVPSFIRLEKYERKDYIVDITQKQAYNRVKIEGKEFISLNNPYHAFWIMPQRELRESIKSEFVRLDTWRELAASYPMWELKKTPLVMVEGDEISPLCYSWHLTNNYASDSKTPFGKIEIKDLLK